MMHKTCVYLVLKLFDQGTEPMGSVTTLFIYIGLVDGDGKCFTVLDAYEVD